MSTHLLDHERLRQHRLKAEYIAAHPESDMREQSSNGPILFAILIAFLIAGSIAGMVA